MRNRCDIWSVLVLSACNSTLGLHDTQRRDAPGLDAPFTCPAPSSDPLFSPLLHQYLFEHCTSYSQSLAGTAAALCGSTIYFGSIDGDLASTGIMSFPGAGQDFEQMRISSDGDELWVLETNNTVVGHVTQIYQHAGSSWNAASAVQPTTGDKLLASAPTARAYGPRHFLRFALPFQEYAENSGGGWSMVATHAFDLDGGTPVEPLSLSANGLRLLIGARAATGQFQLYYTDRDRLDTPFRKPDPLATAPYAPDAYLSEDCAKLFVSGLGYVFYVQPQ